MPRLSLIKARSIGPAERWTQTAIGLVIYLRHQLTSETALEWYK